MVRLGFQLTSLTTGLAIGTVELRVDQVQAHGVKTLRCKLLT